MDYNFTSHLLYSSALLLPIVFIFLFLKPKKASLTNLPPGPPAWTLFVNIFSLSSLPHKTIANMKAKYGPIIWIKVGSVNNMVVLTANAAAEVYKNYDLVFCNRYVFDIVTSHDYHKSSILFSPYGPYWRLIRRLCNTGINSKINDDLLQIRRKGVDDLHAWIGKEADSKNEIMIKDFVSLASINITGNILISRDIAQPNSKVGSGIFTVLTRIFRWIGEPNVCDAFGWLKPFDLQGLRRKMDRDMGQALEILCGIIQERVEEKKNQKDKGKQRKDLLDMLLEYEGKGGDEPEKLSHNNISAFCLEIFFAGVDTVSSTTEWALAELLRDPEKLACAKDEINMIVGPNKKFEEKDIENLPFLQAIVKETLRLHPPVPLIPKKADKDSIFMGYHVPKDTQILVNAWAIGRDPECWNYPLSFKPERFLGSNVDFKGQDYELIPFGAGRRMCVGLPFAHRLLHLLLGSLLHEFEWELKDPTMGIDMREKTGSVVRMLQPLKVIPQMRVVGK